MKNQRRYRTAEALMHLLFSLLRQPAQKKKAWGIGRRAIEPSLSCTTNVCHTNMRLREVPRTEDKALAAFGLSWDALRIREKSLSGPRAMLRPIPARRTPLDPRRMQGDA